MDIDITDCSICGMEHDPETSPDNDSTHLCPGCVSAQQELRHPPTIDFSTRGPPPFKYEPSRRGRP